MFSNSSSKAVQTYLEQAQMYIVEQQWHKAIIACKNIISIDPNSAEAYQIWGNSLQKLEDYSQAIKCYLQAVAIQPNLPEVYANLGKLYAKNQQWSEALQYYAQCLSLAPNFARVYWYVARIWENLGDPERSWSYMFQALELEPELLNAQQHLHIASKLWQKQDKEKALIFYRYAIRLDQSLKEACSQISKIDQQLSGGEEARYTQAATNRENISQKQVPTNSQDLLRGKSKQPFAQEQQIIAREKAKLTQQALPEPSLPVIQLQLGEQAIKQQQWSQAIAYYQEAIKLAPQSALAYFNLGKIYQHLGSKKEAAEAYFQYSRLSRSTSTRLSPQQYLDLGKALLELEQTDRAEVCYREAIRLAPDLNPAYLSLGQVLTAKQDYQGARQAYEHLLQRDRQNIFAYIGLGELAEIQGDEKAAEYYQQALKIETDSSETYHGLGDILSKHQYWQDAVQAYLKAIALNPEFSWSHNNLGDAYLKLGQSLEAAACYRLAIALKNDFFWSYQNLGTALLNLEQWSEAIDAYRQAIKLDSSFSWSYYNLGEGLSKLFRWSEAIAAYRQAIKLEPQLADAYAHLADALIREENWSEGIKYYEQAIELNPGIDIAVYRSLKEALDRQKYLELESARSAARVTENVMEWPYAPINVYQPPATLPDGSPLPKISIVTPSYNQGQFIEETILSVIQQNYPNLEYILVDGTSTDETMAIVNRYQEHFSYIISEPDQGQSSAINKGFRQATGEIFTWLNSDDRLAPGALYAVALAFYSSGADAVAGICQIFQDGKEIEQHLTSCSNGKISLNDILDLENCWLQGKLFYQPEVMFTRKIWEKAGGRVDESLYYSMDYEMWARFAAHGAKLQIIGYPIAQYRLHEQQKTSAIAKYQPELLKVRQSLQEQFHLAAEIASKVPSKERKRLKIVVLNDTGYLGGAGIAHQRIAQALTLAGHQVFPVAGTLDWSLTPINCTAREVLATVASLEPDLLVLGNIHNFQRSLDILETLSDRYPTMFVMHDQWLFTGRCGYTGNCDRHTSLCDAHCPTWDQYPCLAPHKIADAFRRKQALIRNNDQLFILGDSKWLADWAKDAYLSHGNNQTRHEYRFQNINYGLDLQVFRPQEQQSARRQLGLPEDKFIILTGSQSLEDKRKGFKYLLKALEIANLKDSLLLCFGHDLELETQLNIKSVGYLNSPKILAAYYSAADLFVSPALEEAFGQTFIEAAACGTPAVGFAVGGVTEAICDRLSGRTVPQKTVSALAETILELYSDRSQLELLSSLAPWYIASNFSLAASYHSMIVAWSSSDYLNNLGMSAVTKFRVDQPYAHNYLTVKGGNPQPNRSFRNGQLPISITMDESLQGSGWHPAEIVNGVAARWMQKTGTVLIESLTTDKSLLLELEGIMTVDLELLDTMKIKVNGSLIKKSIEYQDDGAWICRGEIPAAILPKQTAFLIAIEVRDTKQLSPQDTRRGSLLMKSLIIKSN